MAIQGHADWMAVDQLMTKIVFQHLQRYADVNGVVHTFKNPLMEDGFLLKR